jgi:hypothetical protein
MDAVSTANTDVVVRRSAGVRSFRREYDYFRHGHVESLENDGDCIRAVVRGNQDYTVALSSGEGVLNHTCNCPVGLEGTVSLRYQEPIGGQTDSGVMVEAAPAAAFEVTESQFLLQ